MRRSCILIALTLATAVRGEDGYVVPGAEAQHAAYDPRAESVMEALADPAAVQDYLAARPRAAYVFTEDRARPIRRSDALPRHWLAAGDGQLERFHGSAQPGEFYVFQLGVYAPATALGPLALRFAPLAGAAGSLPASALRCFNLGGSDFLGRPFAKAVTVAAGRLQALWIGVDIPAAAATGAYAGTITVSAPGLAPVAVAVTLDIAGPAVAEHGDGDSWRLSRLRWLDSTIGLDDDALVAPFTAIVRDGQALSLLGRRVVLGDLGLPAEALSFFSPSNTAVTATALPILARPMRFVVETADGPLAFPAAAARFTGERRGAVAWEARSVLPGVSLTASGLLEQDGYLRWSVRLAAERALALTDVRLESTYGAAASTCFMGLGRRGGQRGKPFTWSWNPAQNQDAYWIGAVNGGMKLRFTGDDSRTPLINAYYHFRELVVPESWGNGGKGRIAMADAADGTVAMVASSGARALAPGAALTFTIEAWITPFKPLDTEGQWRYRYFHPHQGVDDANLRDLAKVKAMGATVVDIHHNKEPNPVINYPYFDQSFPILAKTVEDAHRNGLLLKIYYTTREITDNLPELWAFKSLAGEIICPGPGRDAKPVTNGKGPHPWLVEHLREDFIPAWREVIGGRYQGLLDLAVITTPDSRLDNFYAEGLAYTVRHASIDGLYIDDTALGRKGFQRARRILDAHQPRSQIDMHSWNHFNGLAGNTSSSLVFMQDYPYYNRLWHGEGFDCRQAAPDYWLVEMSGIPFGLMSEMLDNPNPWRGLVFGETARLGWSGDPRPLWHAWDELGIQGTELVGWWDAACPVTTGDPGLLATVYRAPGRALVALGSWRSDAAAATLAIDWRALGIDAQHATIAAPEIPGFQHAAQFAPGAPIPVEAGKGWLLSIGGQAGR
jgi:hypothetical protein